MELQQLLTTEIYNGKTIADVFTLDFLVGVAGAVLSAVLILILGFIIAGWARRRLVSLAEHHQRLDNTLFSFLGNIVRYTILAFTALFVLNTFGIQTTSIVAVIGAAGLAIGLALQGTLSNVAAGVMIIFFRPIKQGDFVEIAGKSGTVRDISLNYTELSDLSNAQVIIPNSEVWGNVITNYSVNATRRVEWTFGVGYGANLQDAERVIRTTVLSDPRALPEPAPFIQVSHLGDSSVDFLVRVWCKAPDFFGYKTDMTRAVKEALDQGGIDIPFPTRTLITAD